MNSKKYRTPLKTETRLNYEMLLAGKVRTFPEVIITFSPFDNREGISAAEINRLNNLVVQEVLNNDERLLIGEVHTLMSVYRLQRDSLFINNLADGAEVRRWRYEWDYLLPLDQSRTIKLYFKSLPLPHR